MDKIEKEQAKNLHEAMDRLAVMDKPMDELGRFRENLMSPISGREIMPTPPNCGAMMREYCEGLEAGERARMAGWKIIKNVKIASEKGKSQERYFYRHARTGEWFDIFVKIRKMGAKDIGGEE